MTFMRYPPPPSVGELPRMWKYLGIVAQSTEGWVETHYAIETLQGDLDIDREKELMAVAVNLLHSTTSREGVTDVDPAAFFVVEHGRRFHRLRFQCGLWGDPAIAAGIN